MKPIRFFLLVSLSLVSTICWSQVNVTLNPSSISPSSYNLNVTTAGDKPGDLFTNYTSQTIKYTWPFLGENIFGNMYASIAGLPLCFKMTVLATGSAGWWSMYGTSTGTITLSSTEQAIINGVWSASNVTRGLTQALTIDLNNFALLKAGNKIMTVTYSLY